MSNRVETGSRRGSTPSALQGRRKTRRKWEGLGTAEARCKRRILRMLAYNGRRPVLLARIVRTMQRPAVHGMFSPAVTRAVIAKLVAAGRARWIGARQDRLVASEFSAAKVLKGRKS